MRTESTIIITDCHGARHYTVTQIAKRFAAGFAAFFITSFLAGGLVIVWLHKEMSHLQKVRHRVQAENEQIVEHNQRLREANSRQLLELATTNAELDKVNSELTQASDDLENIEVLIGVRPDPGADILSRLDTASQTVVEKTLMLQSIPSGYPLEDTTITSGFGARNHPVSGRKTAHAGVDLRADSGTPVMATADGIVEFAGDHKTSGFGNLLIIVHSFGFKTYYGHLKKFAVKNGEFVEKGQVVAYSGNAGRTSGPHLHYEIRHLQRKLNPVPFMKWSLANYDSLFKKEDTVPWDSLAKAIKRRVVAPQQLSLLRELALTVN